MCLHRLLSVTEWYNHASYLVKPYFGPFFSPKKVNFKHRETVMVSLELLRSAMYNKSVLVCGLLAQ